MAHAGGTVLASTYEFPMIPQICSGKGGGYYGLIFAKLPKSAKFLLAEGGGVI